MVRIAIMCRVRYHKPMSDDPTPTRRPLGERDDEERAQPFGARPARHRVEERPPVVTPYTPFRQPQPSPPPPEPAPYEPDMLPALGEEFELVGEEPEPAMPPAAEQAADDAASAGPLEFESYRQRPAPRMSGADMMTELRMVIGSLALMLLSAGVVATMFTWWTPNAFLPAESSLQLAIARATQVMEAVPTAAVPAAPVATAAPPALNNIGIVSGHRGIFPATGLPDPGAVCDDGLTERDVNEAVAVRVVDLLEAEGYQVDLLDEFDERLSGYRALAMVSIHADSCGYVNELATGFKVASFEASSTLEEDQQLVSCLIDRYGAITGLPLHPSITYDMTRYHNFAEIGAETPGAIIEIGFLYLDRDFLTGSPDVVAQGIAEGVLCFLRGELPVGGPPETP